MFEIPKLSQRSNRTSYDIVRSQTANWLTPPELQEKIKIANESDLKDYLLDIYGIVIPDERVCEHHTTPWRAFSDAYFARYPVTVWKASRGFGGKTFMMALLGHIEATTLAADVNILGGSSEQSTRVHEYMEHFWSAPDAPRDLLLGDTTTTRTRLITGNKIVALSASTRSARGPHPQRLRMDEIDEMELKILDAAMGQPMGNRGVAKQTVLSSTHQYSDGTMTEILQRAVEKDWPLYEWCYKETMKGWLDKAEVESKRMEVTDYMWETEYDLQEPSPDSRAINTDSVRNMFRKDLGEYSGAVDEYIQIEPFDPGGKYAHGADWAKKNDYTIIITIRVDCTPMRIVAFLRIRRRKWPYMIAKLNDRIELFGTASHSETSHDATGIGDVIHDYLVDPAIEPVIMAGRTRSEMLSQYITGIENNELVSPFIKFMEGEHRLASVDSVYGSGHLPDTMSAGANAFKAAKRMIERAQAEQHMKLGEQDEDFENKWA